MAKRVGECTNNEDLVEALEALRKQRLNNRRPFETIWWNNIALVAGDHYAEFASNQGQFIEQPKEPHQIRLVINQARVVARQELAKITKTRPIMEVVPKSSDDVDIAASRVSSWALDAAEWKYKLRAKRRSALWWTLLTGISGVYVGWDPNNYDDGVVSVVIDPTTNEPTWDPRRIEVLKKMVETGEINAEVEPEEWALGDLDYKIYSAFQMLPDDSVLEWGDISDIIVVDLVEIEKAKDTWPESAKKIQAEQVRPSTLSQRLIARAGLRSWTTPEQTSSSDLVCVYTYWLKKSVYKGKFLENGKMMRWCNNDVILESTEHCPYADGRLPFAFFPHIPNAVSLWPDTTLTDVRPINLELDKTISQLLENRDYMVNPMWVIPEQVLKRKIKSQPGGEVRYLHVRDVPPPQQIPGVPLPTQIENLVVGLRDMILDVSGMGEVSRGRVPSGVRAQNMLAFLQEEDETKIGQTIEQFEDGIAQMASLTLSRFSQFYTMPRLLRAYRPGGRADVRKFKGADLKGNTDVVVQAGSALPKLKSAKQQYVLQLVELGIEKDPKRIKDWLELGEGEPDDIDMAYAQADRENDLMMRASQGSLDESERQAYRPGSDMSGESPEGAYGTTPAPDGSEQPQTPPGVFSEVGATPELMGMGGNGGPMEMMEGQQRSSFAVPVKAWHLHEAHIQRHRRVMTSAEFEKLALTHPDIVRLFDEHVAMHEQELQQQQMKQLQMMLAARGGPEATTPAPAAQPMAETQAAASQQPQQPQQAGL